MINLEAIQRAREDRAFGQNGWLTFYLEGAPEYHAAMAPGLRELNAENLTEGVGGCVYAKIPVVIDEIAIERKISIVRSLADEAGVEIGIIDLDSDSDVESSKFFTLWLPS